MENTNNSQLWNEATQIKEALNQQFLGKPCDNDTNTIIKTITDFVINLNTSFTVDMGGCLNNRKPNDQGILGITIYFRVPASVMGMWVNIAFTATETPRRFTSFSTMVCKYDHLTKELIETIEQEKQQLLNT